MSFRSPRSPSLNRSTSSLDKKNNPISFDDYEGSEFEYNPNETNEAKSNKKQETKRYEISSSAVSVAATTSKGLPSKSVFRDAQSREEGHVRAYHFASMNAFSKHKKLVNDYLRYYSGGKTLEEVFKRDTSRDKTDLDVIREEMKFVWDEEQDEADTWEKRLAKRYYDKLFKEYCICDLTFFKQNKIAMRWRVEKEVIEGKGQFICGDKRCSERDGLKSWEVNFGYVEHGEKKNALVKLRLCPDCSYKLNYHHKRKEVKKVVKTPEVKTSEDLKRKDSTSSSSSEDEEEEETTTKTKKLKTNEKEETSTTAKEETKKEELTKDGNIIVSGDDSLWKTKPSEQASALFDEKRHREDEFENYLEDLLL